MHQPVLRDAVALANLSGVTVAIGPILPLHEGRIHRPARCRAGQGRAHGPGRPVDDPLLDLDHTPPGPGILLPTLQQIREGLGLLRLDGQSSSGRSDEADPYRDGYITIERAAEITNISDSYLRRVIHSGELPASNIGSAVRPTWRIARKDLDEWMRKKQGESPKLPAKSALDDLIRRHLPGL